MTTMTDVQGWFKSSYADKITDLIPDSTYYAKEIPDVPSTATPGGDYQHPVNLTSEQGVTKASSAAGAFALNAPVSMLSRQATLAGSQMLLRSALDYETIMRSESKNAFVKATKGVIKNMIKSAYFQQEYDIMWGRNGLGILSNAAGVTLTFTAASWASGLWLGSENRVLRVETAGGVLRGTCTVVSYDIEARTVTVDALPPGAAATDVVFLSCDGATGANQMLGLYSANITAGTIWGISKTTFNLWSPVSAYSAGTAPLSFNKIMKALVGPGNKRLGDEIREIDVIVNPGAWTDLGNDLAALRSIDSTYKTQEIMAGSESFVFMSPYGRVRIIAHRLMKEGFSFIHPKASRSMALVGAQSKPTFELPGKTSKNGEYLREMENNAGVETRIYWNAAVFTEYLAHTRVINNIVNAT